MSIAEFYDLLTSPQNVILFLGAAGTFLTVIALVLPFTQRDLMAPRLAVVAARRDELRKAAIEAAGQRKTMRRTEKLAHITFMGRVLDRLNLLKQLESRELRSKLAQAGLRGQAPVVMFVFGRLILPFVFGPVAFLVILALQLELEFIMRAGIIVGAVYFGYAAPGIFVSNLAAKRLAPMALAFPDALDLLVICVEAGSSLEVAFNRVAEDIAEQAPELAQEFGLTTAELSFLGDRRIALENMAERIALPAVRSLAMALFQSEKYGTPLTVALRVLAKEGRDDRMAKAEEKAGSLPAMLTGPMIVFFLPVTFIVLLGPAIIQIVNM